MIAGETVLTVERAQAQPVWIVTESRLIDGVPHEARVMVTRERLQRAARLFPGRTRVDQITQLAKPMLRRAWDEWATAQGLR